MSTPLQSDDIELMSRANHGQQTVPSSTERQLDALPPTDAGYLAWVALFGAGTTNAVIWGFAFSFGVLQEFYSTHEPFAGQSGIAAVGTTSTGIMYLTMPLFLLFFRRWPSLRKPSMLASIPAMVGSLIGASFARSVPVLIVFQGVVFAVGANAIVMPGINFLNEWFVRRKGFAVAATIAGDYLGGGIMPLILQWSLGRFGVGWTLRLVAAIITVFTVPYIFLVRPRVPVSAISTVAPLDTSFLWTKYFWATQFCNVVQAMGYFLPINYLPSMAESLGLGSPTGPITILLLNLSAFFGCIGTGALLDRFDVVIILAVLSLLSAASIFGVLGFTNSTAPLFVFSALYGLLAAPFSTSWGGTIKELQKFHAGTDANFVFGLLAFGRGVGSLISGPLSSSLVSSAVSWNESFQNLYGSEYRNVVIFAGCTAVGGGTGWIIRQAGLLK